MKLKIFAIPFAGLCLWLERIQECNTDCYPEKNEENKVAIYCNETVYYPDYINENVEILKIYGDSGYKRELVVLDPMTFSRLTFLLLAQIPELKAPKNYLSLLRNLKNLSIVFVNFADENAVPELPTTIINLTIVGIKFHSKNSIDLSKLNNLETLTYARSNLPQLPSFPVTAPITQLDLVGNPLTNLQVPDVASLCLLKNINLKSTSIQFGSIKAYCEFKAWFESHDINCQFDEEKVKGCSSNAERIEEAEKKYDECVARTDPERALPKILISVVVVVVVFVLSLLTAGVFFFILRNSPQKIPEIPEYVKEEDIVEESYEET